MSRINPSVQAPLAPRARALLRARALWTAQEADQTHVQSSFYTRRKPNALNHESLRNHSQHVALFEK